MLLVSSYRIDCPDACGGQALVFAFDMGDDDPDAADEYTEAKCPSCGRVWYLNDDPVAWTEVEE